MKKTRAINLIVLNLIIIPSASITGFITFYAIDEGNLNIIDVGKPLNLEWKIAMTIIPILIMNIITRNLQWVEVKNET